MPFLGSGAGTALGRPRTFLNIVLDESSSMDRVTDTTIRAYNDFLAQQRDASAEAKDEVFVSCYKFSDHAERVYAQVPLADAPELDRRTYSPDGSTALYDGIYQAIRETEQAVGPHARVLTLVITDGEENCSKMVQAVDVIKQMVDEREARGNWTFVFLSAGRNPYDAGKGLGFKVGNIRPYAAGDSASQALTVASRNMRSYRQGDALQTETFWAGEALKHNAPEWAKGAQDEEVEDVV